MLLLLALVLHVCSQQPMDYVNTFIGTDGQGFGIGENVPGASRPYGFIRASPDTSETNFIIPAAWEHNGGYYWGDQYINCFSHTHMAGAGVADYGTIAIMPLAKATPEYADIWSYGFRSPFSHDNEKASPGFYSVYLDGPQVQADVTATENTGVHRYTWLGSQSKSILFPISHSIVNQYPSGCKGANITIDFASQEVSGYIKLQGALTGRIGDYFSYFVAKFDTPFSYGGVWNGGYIYPYQPNGNQTISTVDKGNIVNINGIGAYVTFPTTSASVESYVGVSSISIAQARRNLQVQVAGKNFNQVVKDTQNLWQPLFSRVNVKADKYMNETLVKFWTAFYRVLTVPSSFSEADGMYLGFDRQPHQLPSGQNRFFTDMSIWDIVRTQIPWTGFFQPDIMKDIVGSLKLMYLEGGDLPKWPIANGYGECMVGAHSIPVIVDAYFKGIPMDVQTMYKAMKQILTQNQAHAGIDVGTWNKYGYIPVDIDNKGASVTLELCYDSWALSTMAKALGYNDDAVMFYNMSQGYKKIFHPTYKFFCPKTSTGVWQCPVSWINIFDNNYVEGDAWHYRFYVPGDPDGLVNLFGKQDFADQLSEFMYRAELDPFTVLPNPYYWAGNEPGLLSPFLFNFAGRLDLNSRYVAWIKENRYTPDADGLPGNDDYGTMSAWYLWTSFGLYPIGGGTQYLLTTPAFEYLELNRPSGKLTVTSNNFSPLNIYITKATVNGKPIDLNRPIVEWSDLQGNCNLQFWLSPTSPNGETIPMTPKVFKAKKIYN